ncbi:MAG: SMP-30/gluconolactonase/LRE family protein, partial [Myxococcales bacterium]
LYVTGSEGVTVLSPAGDKLGVITGTGSATNCAFGGPDHRTLFITAGKRLYRLAVGIPGSPS